jgi:hypothetical protein
MRIGLSDVDQVRLTWMLLIALSFLLIPDVSWMFGYVFTPLPPDHDQVVFHAIVVPLRLVTCAHCEPDAPEMPH